MIIRLVKMTFHPEAVKNFLQLFHLHREEIRHFSGCRHLELWQDKNTAPTFFTYSHWDSEAALEYYRHSALFHEVWAETKKGFSDKPEVWTVSQKLSLPSVTKDL